MRFSQLFRIILLSGSKSLNLELSRVNFENSSDELTRGGGPGGIRESESRRSERWCAEGIGVTSDEMSDENMSDEWDERHWPDDDRCAEKRGDIFSETSCHSISNSYSNISNTTILRTANHHSQKMSFKLLSYIADTSQNIYLVDNSFDDIAWSVFRHVLIEFNQCALVTRN